MDKLEICNRYKITTVKTSPLDAYPNCPRHKESRTDFIITKDESELEAYIKSRLPGFVVTAEFVGKVYA